MLLGNHKDMGKGELWGGKVDPLQDLEGSV